MNALICAPSHSDGREPPDLAGFEQENGEWRLRLDSYETFIHEVTGVEVTGDISPQQLKTVQSRLEGCLERYERSGSCLCDDLHRYGHIDSMDTVHELSRFFRMLVASRVEGLNSA